MLFKYEWDIKIGVILPSRGLIFSKTADEILRNVEGLPHKFFFSHRKPIPQCFEDPTFAALKDSDISHIWYVEDDMILPSNTLKTMLAMNKAVVTADYPVNSDGRGAVFTVDKQIIFGGTGCLLVTREVLEELKPPYFRTDIRWNIKNFGDYLKMTRVETGQLDGYGLHDVNFYMNLYRLGIPVHKIDKKLGQRKLVALGKAGTNDGAHNIEEWKRVVANHLLKQVKKYPVVESGDLVTVVTPTGEISTSKAHARTLIKKGLGTKPPRRKLVVDWNKQ